MADFPDKVVNPAFSARYGLPPGTELIGPPMQGTIITNLPGQHGGPMLAYDGPWPPPDEKVGKAAPAPAGTSTPPPEGAHKTDEYRVTSLAPSMELTNDQPVPYGITATAQNDTLYSPNVTYRGTAAMRLSSRITVNTGDEPANGRKGVASGAQGGMAAPITSSSIVRINGSPAIRHGDLFEMDKASVDGPGNTIGEGRLVRDTAPRAAPEDDRSWWQRAKDGVRGAAEAVGDFDAAHGHVLTRGLGAVQAVGGGIEAVAGVAGGVLTSETGVGAVAGGVVALNGADNFQAGLRTLWYGQSTRTVTQTAVGGGIRAVGGGETAATVSEMVAGFGPGGIASAARIPGRIAALGRAAEEAPAAARAAEAVPAVEAAGRTASEAKQAEEAGVAGVRVTRNPLWKKVFVNGRRVYQRDDLIDPNKLDSAGRTNLERMRKGLAPLGPDGKPVNLHHLTQTEPGALAEVEQTFHQQNTSILHMPDQYSFRNDPDLSRTFDNYRRSYWKSRADDFPQ